MQPALLANFCPVCPVCRVQGHNVPLQVALVTRQAVSPHFASQPRGADLTRDQSIPSGSSEPAILEGILQCQQSRCAQQYPIIDGLPVLVPKLEGFLSDQALAFLARDDLSPAVSNLLGNCWGAGSLWEAHRQLVSHYAWDHYADLNPNQQKAPQESPESADDEPLLASPARENPVRENPVLENLEQEGGGTVEPGGVVRVLQRLLDLAGPLGAGPVLEVGCSVGRGVFYASACLQRPVLGVDLNVSMLRMASQVLHQGFVSYDLRQVGLIYHRQEYPVRFVGAADVDFWVADTLALPCSSGQFAAVICVNTLDCVSWPVGLLAECARVLAPGGHLLLSTPYDWPASTPQDRWLGGLLPSGHDKSTSSEALRQTLEGHHWRVTQEEESFPWHVRLHERATMLYRLHLVVAQKISS